MNQGGNASDAKHIICSHPTTLSHCPAHTRCTCACILQEKMNVHHIEEHLICSCN